MPTRSRWSSSTARATRREHRFGAVAQAVRTMAAELHDHGVRRGDVVLTLAGNQPDWVVAMVACFRQGYVVLPCTEQLRAKDLRLRLDVTRPAAVVADRRNADVLAEAGWDGPTIWGPGIMDRPAPEAVPPAADLAPLDPCLITFTSGTAGEPKAVLHGQRYLDGQQLQAEHWLAARPGDLVWCTAASGWSKSARNVFIAPWLRGATALLHDARFDPAERLDILERERVAVLCMAPTEYRVIAKRVELRRFPELRALVAAGEALNPEVLEVWRDATGLEIRDGYGQTETGQLTGNLDGEPARAGSMGRALPGVKLWIEDGELVADPATVPTFFLKYLGDDATGPRQPALAHRRPRDRRRRRLPLLRGPHRRRHHLGRLPHRPVRGRVSAWSPTRPSPRPRSSPRPTRSAARSSGRSSCCATVMRPATSSPARSRTTSRPRPRPTSTRASSSSPMTCPRRRAARCAARCCAASSPRDSAASGPQAAARRVSSVALLQFRCGV